MLNPRLPKSIFVFLVVLAFIYFWNFYSQLPEVVASHFDRWGRPNGWQPKSSFFTVFLATTVLAAFLVFGLSGLIRVMPVQLINLPNKRYWLGPEQRESTLDYLSSYFAWFGCAVFLVIFFAFDYAVRSNLHPGHPPSSAHLWFPLITFLGLTLVGTSRLLIRFTRPPQDSSLSE